MRKSIMDRAHDNQIKWMGQFEFGAADIRPLYLELGALEGEHPLKFCDLKHIIIALVRNAHPSNKNIEMAAKIVMTYDSIARGGEVKFQKFTDWSFDYMTYVLDTQWKEAKTCDVYAMARVSDKRWWFCFFFVMGAYAMCADGLHRSEEQIDNGFQHAVFPDLQKYSDNYITTLVGNWMKKGLEWCKEEVNGIEDFTKKFSAKSCRMGAVNELACHPLITVFNVCARTGHSVGEGVNALQSYLDRLNVILGLPAALALHGYKNIHPKKVVYPKITAVGSSNMESMKRLVTKMFVISIPEFKENGELREVVYLFAASLILHYKEVIRDCGHTNLIASTLEKCAEAAGITYAGRPHLSYIDVLKEYSDDIRTTFEEDAKTCDMGGEADAMGSAQLKELFEIARDVKEIKRNEKDLSNELAVSKQALERSNQENKRLREELDQTRSLLQQANSKLSFLKSNSSPVRPEKRPRLSKDAVAENEVLVDDNPELLGGEDGSNGGELAAAKPKPDTVAAKPKDAKELRNTNASASFNSRSGDQGFELTCALKQLSEANLFHRGKRLDSITIPNTLCENRDKLQHCLTLIDFAGDPSDIDKLCTEYSFGEDEALIDVTTRLVKAARDKLFEFEGTTYEIELRRRGARAPGLSVTGLAKRVVAYRKKIQTDLSLDEGLKPSEVGLMELSELQARKKEKEAPKKATVLDNFLVRKSTSTNSSNDE